MNDQDPPVVETRPACTYRSPVRGLVCDRHHGHRDECRARVETAHGAFIITWRPATEAPSRIP